MILWFSKGKEWGWIGWIGWRWVRGEGEGEGDGLVYIYDC